jgi:hypothetical protein
MSSIWKLKYFCWSMSSDVWASVSVSGALMSVFLVYEPTVTAPMELIRTVSPAFRIWPS